mmetsp:Transcript_3909/g.6934  ORF Transcript_3909/g.6934 Transcript_3909/m.6934 type:complete len:80 (-) Transcript_3909:312-551(-)|eukprot:CAMPEP_0201605748 /NCGR_PEP_ID=MMETSP0492-20130828/5452_1 /ASSEMBLY_ACC=CAM_ASM_000837 /TAXON_ID=420259 /ORGANISM="Thalassiosira gravida, Strain GMp14c1" /LENGTH=79 /DNA_ID=CAMNT_0048070051 /DNA_START=98 /DNA_END=337 /DNA_ORIENTATION=+
MATIQSFFTNTQERLTGYYRPLFKAGSVKPLWHMMIVTSVIMYTQSYVFNKGKHIQAARQEKKIALEEYYAKHGKSGHH